MRQLSPPSSPHLQCLERPVLGRLQDLELRGVQHGLHRDLQAAILAQVQFAGARESNRPAAECRPQVRVGLGEGGHRLPADISADVHDAAPGRPRLCPASVTAVCAEHLHDCEGNRVCVSGLQQREKLQPSPSGLRHVFETNGSPA